MFKICYEMRLLYSVFIDSCVDLSVLDVGLRRSFFEGRMVGILSIGSLATSQVEFEPIAAQCMAEFEDNGVKAVSHSDVHGTSINMRLLSVIDSCFNHND